MKLVIVCKEAQSCKIIMSLQKFEYFLKVITKDSVIFYDLFKNLTTPVIKIISVQWLVQCIV